MLSTMKVKSLFAALTLAIGLQGLLLWSMNEVARSAGEHQLTQAVQPESSVAALTELSAPRQITLAPVTIVARRETAQAAPGLAPTEKLASREVQTILHPAY
jgi:hypothetical protein